MNIRTLGAFHPAFAVFCACMLALSLATPVFAETDAGAGADVNVSVTSSTGQPLPNPLSGLIDRLKMLRNNLQAPGTPPTASSTDKRIVPLPGGPGRVVPCPATTDVRLASTTPKNPCLGDGDLKRIASTTRDKLLELASTTRAKILDRIDLLKKQQQDNEARRKENLDKVKKKVSDAAYNSIRNIFENLGKAHDKLGDILAKVSSDLAAGAAEGVDVTTANTAVVTAQADLDAAQTAIDAVQTEIEAAAASDTPKDHMDKIRVAVKAATDAIQKAHRSTLLATQAARLALGSNIQIDAGASGTMQ